MFMFLENLMMHHAILISIVAVIAIARLVNYIYDKKADKFNATQPIIKRKVMVFRKVKEPFFRFDPHWRTRGFFVINPQPGEPSFERQLSRRQGHYIIFRSLPDRELIELRVKRRFYNNHRVGEHGTLSSQGYRIVDFERDDSVTLPTIEKASFKQRAYAFMVDFIILFVVVMEFIVRMQIERVMVAGLFLADWLILLILIFVLIFKDIFKGQSPGKIILKIAVRTATDPKIKPSFRKLVLRNIYMTTLPIELIVMVRSSDKRKLGDKLAGTDVYYVP